MSFFQRDYISHDFPLSVFMYNKLASYQVLDLKSNIPFWPESDPQDVISLVTAHVLASR